MPLLSRWCVRAGLLYLVAGMALGSWMLLQPALDRPSLGHPWPALHAHIPLMGFLLMLIMGVAHWMFTRVRGRRPGREGGWVPFALINAGLLLRVAAEPAVVHGRGGAWRVVLGAAAVLPAVGAATFAVTILPRVRSVLSPQEARRVRARSVAPSPE